jgi:hypothetical protein
MLAQELHRCGSFWPLLLSIDRDLAECARRQGCLCGGRLHRANYPRVPRGGPEHLPHEYRQRFSFCCERDGWRKRLTPPSARFLGRKEMRGNGTAVCQRVASSTQAGFRRSGGRHDHHAAPPV